MRLSEILAAEEANSSTIKTKPTLTPAKACRRAERQRKLQQQIRDTQAAATKKVSDLRTKISAP